MTFNLPQRHLHMLHYVWIDQVNLHLKVLLAHFSLSPYEDMVAFIMQISTLASSAYVWQCRPTALAHARDDVS